MIVCSQARRRRRRARRVHARPERRPRGRARTSTCPPSGSAWGDHVRGPRPHHRADVGVGPAPLRPARPAHPRGPRRARPSRERCDMPKTDKPGAPRPSSRRKAAQGRQAGEGHDAHGTVGRRRSTSTTCSALSRVATTTRTRSSGRTRTTGGVTIRTLRPWATTDVVVVDDRGGESRTELTHEHGGIFVGVLDLAERARLPPRGRRTAASRRSVDDPYRFLPTLGELDLHLIGEGRHETLWTALGAHEHVYPSPARRRARHVVRGVGAQRPGRARRRRLQRLGRHRHPDALARLAPGSGSCSSRASAPAPRYKFAILGRTGSGATKADPLAFAHRASRRRPRRSCSPRRTSGATTTWLAARRRARPAQLPDVDLRGAPRARGARAWTTAELADELVGLRHRDGLHPRRADAGHRAPVRAELGLPGHVVLRADLAVRHARRLPLPRRPPAPGRHRRHPRLGARALPEGRVGAGPLRRHAALRARRPAPRRAARLGHLRVRLRPHARCATSWSPTRSTGSRSSTSTACAWTPSPRCSTWTTRARRASGCPTSTAAARTSRRCRSCRR